MTDQGFCLRKVNVGLDVPASADTPPFVFHQFLNLPEELRVVFFDPAVKKRFVVVEYELVMRLDEFYRVLKSGECFGTAFFPSPLPDRVEVSVTDEMNTELFLL